MSNNTPSNIQCYIHFLKRKKKLVQLCVVADGLRHHVLKASAHSDLPPLATLHEVSVSCQKTNPGDAFNAGSPHSSPDSSM